MRVAASLTAISLLLAAAAAQARGQEALSPRQQATVVNEIVPAYRMNRPLLAHRAVSMLVARMNDEQLAALDRLLQANEMPPAGELLANVRLTAMLFGSQQKLPKPQARELLLTLQAILQQINAGLQAQQALIDEGAPGRPACRSSKSGCGRSMC